MQNQICCRNVCRQGRERYVYSSRDKRLTSARNIQTRHRRTVNTFTISFPSNVLSPDVCMAYFRLDRATRVRHQRKREPPHRHKSIRWKKTSSLSLSLSFSFLREKSDPLLPLRLSEDRSCEFYQSQSFLADDLRLIFLQIRFRFGRFSRTRLFEVVCGRMEKCSPSNHFGSGLRKYF